MNARPSTRFLAALLASALPFMAIPAGAADTAATLTGSIVRSETAAPLVGARLHVGDPKTDRMYSSTPADTEGSFVLAELPSATYSLAVEAEGGLYVVETPLSLAPGTTRTLNLAVTPQPVNLSDDDGSKDKAGSVFSFKENPLTATLLFLGIVIVLGVAIGGSSSSSNNIPPSPSTPPGP